MASVWVHMKGEKKPRKHVGNLPRPVAIQHYRSVLREWKSNPANQIVPVFDFESILKRNGKLIGSVFVEFYSQPSNPEPGQPRRVAHG